MNTLIVLAVLLALADAAMKRKPGDYNEEQYLPSLGISKLCHDALSLGCCMRIKKADECNSDFALKYCELTCFKCILPPQCKTPLPLGMENKDIPDTQITASSTYSGYSPAFARLHSKYVGWCPANAKPGMWLQVDLGKITIVSAIATQGRSSYWMTKYSLGYSVADGSTFMDYQKDKVQEFTGNTDGNSVVTNGIDPPIRARYIRIYPKQWQNGWPILRIELYGCKIRKQEG